jgi:hypothetical protein
MYSATNHREIKLIPIPSVAKAAAVSTRPHDTEAAQQEWDNFKANMPDPLLEKLFGHQIEGVRWMYHIHKHHRGAILGDG